MSNPKWQPTRNERSEVADPEPAGRQQSRNEHPKWQPTRNERSEVADPEPAGRQQNRNEQPEVAANPQRAQRSC